MEIVIQASAGVVVVQIVTIPPTGGAAAPRAPSSD